MKIALLTLSLFLAFPPLYIQGGTPVTTDPLATDSIPKLFKWFDNLVSEYDKFVDKEKKKQFLRKLTKLNESLYKLQRRKEEFLAELEVKAPRYTSWALVEEMKDSFEDLQEQFARVQNSVRDLGGLVNSEGVSSEGVMVAQSLSAAASERKKGVLEISYELERGEIDLPRVRQLGEMGIAALKDAQLKLSKMIQDLEKRS